MTVAVELKIGFPEAAAPQAGVLFARTAGTASFRAGWETLLAALGAGMQQELAGGQDAVAQGKPMAGAAEKGTNGSGTGMASKTGEAVPAPVTGQFARQNLPASAAPQVVAGESGLVQNLPDAMPGAGALAEGKAAGTPAASVGTGEAAADPLPGMGARKTRADRSASIRPPAAAQRTERESHTQNSTAAAVAAAAQSYVPPSPIEVHKIAETGESKGSADRISVASRGRQGLEELTPGKETQVPSGGEQLAARESVPDGSGGTFAEIGPAEGGQDQAAAIPEEGPAAAAGESARKSGQHAVQGLDAAQEALPGGKGMAVSAAVPERQGRVATSGVADLQGNTERRTGGSAAADAAVTAGASASAHAQSMEETRNIARAGGTEQAVTPGKPVQAVAEPAGRKDQAVRSAPAGKGTGSPAATHPEEPASAESPAKPIEAADRTTHTGRSWPGSHLQETHQAAVQPAAQPAILFHPAQAQSGGMTVGGAGGQGSSVSAASASAGGAHPDAFSTLDAAAPAATWIHGTAPRAEAGFQDPSLGWVSVRAEAGTGGIHASVVASTADAAQALGGHMASLATHLAERHLPVETLTFSSSGGQSLGAGADRGANQNSQQNGGQAPYANQREQPASGPVTEARPAPRFAEEAVRTPVWNAVSGGGRISVVA